LSTIKVNNIENRTGSSITIGGSSTTSLDLASTITGGTLTNTPAFKAGITELTIGYNTFTKITYNSEIIDTDNAYDSSNSKFTVPTGKGGVYFLGAFYTVATGTDSTGFQMHFYKNGSLLEADREIRAKTVNQSYNTVQAVGISELSAGDYIEVYANQASGGATDSYNIGYANQGRFYGYKLIGV